MQENGVETAIQSLYRDLEYAKSLIKEPNSKAVDDQPEDSEESWTFIGDENDPDPLKRLYHHERVLGSVVSTKDENEELMMTSVIDTGSGRSKSMTSSILTPGVKQPLR